MQNSNFAGKTKNWVILMIYQSIFWFIDRFSIVFLFKIQISNENDKLVGFFNLSLSFFWFITQFFRFLFFSKKIKINKSNWSIFDEPTKPVRTSFIGFRPIFQSMVPTLHKPHTHY
jgi:hypothetical protein